MLPVVLGLSLVLQDPQPERQEPPDPPPQQEQQEKEKQEKQEPEPTWEEWDDRRARAVLREVKDLLRGRRVPLRERMAAVQKLAAGSNERLVKPLATMVLADSSVVVRKSAAEALGHQPQKEAKRALLVLLRNERLEDEPPVQAALVTSLAKNGYEARDWRHLDGMFERRYSPEHTGLQQAILKLVIAHEEKQAIDMLLDNLGEPVPVNVDDPSNPPAEYWEKRWKAWEVWRADVKQALFVITGQRFSTKAEAEEWLDENGHKIGIR